MNESPTLSAESGTVQCTANFLYTALMMCATVTHAPVFTSKVSRNVLTAEDKLADSELNTWQTA